VGIDGNIKMSKSRGNTIDLKDSAEIVAGKVLWDVRGTSRGREGTGHGSGESCFSVPGCIRSDAEHVRDLKERYEGTGVSNKELKDRLTTVLNELLEPMRERRAKFASNKSLVREALEQGTQRGPRNCPGHHGDGAGRS
jgi:tryptophanyl-tRNA synthetase